MCTFVDVKRNIKPGKLQIISTFFTFAIGITALLGVLEPKIAHNFGYIQLENGGVASLREDINEKKNVFFRALPKSPKPLPPDPNSGNLVLFFWTSKFKIHLRTKSAKKLINLYIK